MSSMVIEKIALARRLADLLLAAARLVARELLRRVRDVETSRSTKYKRKTKMYTSGSFL